MKVLGEDFFLDAVAVDHVGPQATDAGLADLEALTTLELLHLEVDQFTDATLPRFERLTKLRELYLVDTKVTLEGRIKLHRALPGCNIVVYGTRGL